MSKHCPVLNRKVVYLDCMECDERSACSNIKITNSKKNPIITTNTIGFLKYHLIRCECGATPVLNHLPEKYYEVFCPSCGKRGCPVHYVTGATVMWNRNLFDAFTDKDIKDAAKLLNIETIKENQKLSQVVKDVLTKGKEVR